MSWKWTLSSNSWGESLRFWVSLSIQMGFGYNEVFLISTWAGGAFQRFCTLDLDPYTGFWQSYGGSCCSNLRSYCMQVFPCANGSPTPWESAEGGFAAALALLLQYKPSAISPLGQTTELYTERSELPLHILFLWPLCQGQHPSKGEAEHPSAGGKHLAGRIMPWAVAETFVQSSHIKAFVDLAQTPVPLFLKVVLAGELLPLFPCIV